MIRLASVLAAVLLLALSSASAVEVSVVADRDTLQTHVKVLASDSLEGREVGEPGAYKASVYIAEYFKAHGLQPAGDNDTYFQNFDFIKAIEPTENNALAINGKPLTIGEDYRPLHWSGDTRFDFDKVIDVGYGIITDDSSHNDYEGVDVSDAMVIIRRYAPESNDPHAGMKAEDSTGLADTLYDRHMSFMNKIMTAEEQGAKGIIFITPVDYEDAVGASGVTRVASKDIPILWVKRTGLAAVGVDSVNPVIDKVEGQVELIRVRDTCRNVVAELQGESDSVIVIGAHYDHLGWGTPSSRYVGQEKMIHYGADDNGSGTSALMELARLFSEKDQPLRHSVLFVAFSGEESGLLGSSHFVRNWTVPREDVSMMINMDMIGRLQDQDKGLLVMGTGTCEKFTPYFDSLDTCGLKITQSESGAGPSDHSAFYNDSVPVLNFFTGAHADYHKPDDTWEKLDYDGLAKVTSLVSAIVTDFDTVPGPLTFVRTKSDNQGRMHGGWKVTLGIMPDYVAEVEGLRIDGVSDDRPAFKAGLLKGDIIIKLGAYPVQDIYGYMNALGHFSAGEATEVTVVRESDTLTVPLQF